MDVGNGVGVGEFTAEEAFKKAVRYKPYWKDNGGITVSGGEPLLQADFVWELFTELKRQGIHTAVDTCGNVSWKAFEKVLPVADMFLFDVKHIDSQAHKRLTGAGNERILENLRKLSDAGARIEIRMPLVPGCNDDEKTLAGIGEMLGKLRIERMKVLPYHSMGESKLAALGRLPHSYAVPDKAHMEALAHAIAK